MHIAVKSLIGLGCVGTIGGGGYAVSYLLATNEIADKLVSNGYTILASDSTHWKDILVSYKALTESDNDLKFGNFPGTAEELAKHCQKLLDPHTSEDVKNKKNYKKAEKWCVVPVTVLDILKHEKYVELRTDKTNNKVADNKEWETKIKAHKKSNQKISGLEFASTEDPAVDADVEKIKTKCREIGAKKNHEKDYEKNLNHFRLWCSNKAES